MELSVYVFPGPWLGGWVAELVAAEDRGYAGAWVPQVFGWDALTALALAGGRTSRLRLGTAVVPTHPTHPLVLAQAALTTQAACGGRLTLGVGVSHAFIVEGIWGYSYARPLAWLREYLSVLVPALHGERVRVEGDHVTARPTGPLQIPGVPPPPVLAAALAPRMLRLAGEQCAGTVAWLAGRRTLRDHLVPTIRAAATATGRPMPRVVAGLPVCVTTHRDRARDHARKLLDVYQTVPAYRALLDREGVAEPADLALIGPADHIAEQLAGLADTGVDELMLRVFGDDAEQAATHDCLSALHSTVR